MLLHCLISHTCYNSFIIRYQLQLKAPRLTFKDIGTRGRLGNQLFQIASTIGIAETNGLLWEFPTSIANCTAGQLFRLHGDFEQNDPLLNFTVYEEVDEASYNAKLPIERISSHNMISLRGYFQEYRYFERSHGSLRNYLKVPPELISHVRSAVPEVSWKHSLTLHIRRGDYVGNHLYSSVEFEYYQRALRQFENVSVIIIVTDDKTWAELEVVPRLRTQYKVIMSPFDSASHDFVLLMLGEHMILANSSFSWWAAYMRKFHTGLRHGHICAPQPWYNVSSRFSRLNRLSFYPSDWRLIRVTQ